MQAQIKKNIIPDHLFWLTKYVLNYLKDVKKNDGVSLYDSLKEYLSVFTKECHYFSDKKDNLILYPVLEWISSNNTLVLKGFEFLSSDAYKLKTINYLNGISSKECNIKKVSIFSKIKSLFSNSFSVNFNDLNSAATFLSASSNLDFYEAKEVLLLNSYKRQLSLENLASKAIINGSLKDVNKNEHSFEIKIKFNFFFLTESKFFEVEKYSEFKKHLADNCSTILNFKASLKYNKAIPENIRKKYLINN